MASKERPRRHSAIAVSARAKEDEASSNDKVEDRHGMTPREFFQEIIDKREDAILDWHDEACKYPPKIDAFLDPANQLKNRFKGVLLYDSTRVQIKDKFGTDYYHASFVDSYDKKDGYIFAQAPFDEPTECDFWRMIMKLKPIMIIVNGSQLGADGSRRMKNFWPGLKQERLYAHNAVRVRCSHYEQERDHDNFEIACLLTGMHAKQGFTTQLVQNRRWIEDKDVPHNLLDFRAVVKIALARAENDGRTGPVMLCCPSGVHRCGTFAALNILLERLMCEKKVGMDETLTILRAQRYGCLAIYDHYKILHELIVRQAVSLGMVNPGDVGNKRKPAV